MKRIKKDGRNSSGQVPAVGRAKANANTVPENVKTASDLREEAERINRELLFLGERRQRFLSPADKLDPKPKSSDELNDDPGRLGTENPLR